MKAIQFIFNDVKGTRHNEINQHICILYITKIKIFFIIRKEIRAVPAVSKFVEPSP